MRIAKNIIILTLTLAAFLLGSCVRDSKTVLTQTITFEEVRLASESYWNGNEGSGVVRLGAASFSIMKDTEFYEYWEGFAYSNITDTETRGFENQYSAYVKDIDLEAKNTYAVVYIGEENEESAVITFINEAQPKHVQVTNSTYVYHTLNEGDDYTEKFEDGDWFLLTITGYNGEGNKTNTIEFYLADFRDGKNKIIDTWERIDLTPLEGSIKLIFNLSSSDVGDFGMNTPSYFCMDNLHYVIEN